MRRSGPSGGYGASRAAVSTGARGGSASRGRAQADEDDFDVDDIEFSDLSDDGGDIVIGGGGSSRPGQAAGRPGGPAGLPPRPNTSGRPGAMPRASTGSAPPARPGTSGKGPTLGGARAGGGTGGSRGGGGGHRGHFEIEDDDDLDMDELLGTGGTRGGGAGGGSTSLDFSGAGDDLEIDFSDELPSAAAPSRRPGVPASAPAQRGQGPAAAGARGLTSAPAAGGGGPAMGARPGVGGGRPSAPAPGGRVSAGAGGYGAGARLRDSDGDISISYSEEPGLSQSIELGNSLDSAELDFGSEASSVRPTSRRGAPTSAGATARGGVAAGTAGSRLSGTGGGGSGPAVRNRAQGLQASQPDAEIMSFDSDKPVLTQVKTKGRAEPKIESFSFEFSDVSEGNSMDLEIEHSPAAGGARAVPAAASRPPLQGGAQGARGALSAAAVPGRPPLPPQRPGAAPAGRQAAANSDSFEISGSIDIEHSDEEEVEVDAGRLGSAASRAQPAPTGAARTSLPSGGAGPGAGRQPPTAAVAASGGGNRGLTGLTNIPGAAAVAAAKQAAASRPSAVAAAPVRRLSRTPDSTPDISGSSSPSSAPSSAASSSKARGRGRGGPAPSTGGMRPSQARGGARPESRAGRRSSDYSQGSGSASQSESPPPRPQLHTIDDLAGDLDDLYSQLQPVQRFGGQGSSSGSGSKGSSSAESSPARPRIMTIDALEEASGSIASAGFKSEDIVSEEEEEEEESPRRPALRSIHDLEAAESLGSSRSRGPGRRSASGSTSSSQDKPRLMTLDALEAASSLSGTVSPTSSEMAPAFSSSRPSAAAAAAQARPGSGSGWQPPGGRVPTVGAIALPPKPAPAAAAGRRGAAAATRAEEDEDAGSDLSISISHSGSSRGSSRKAPAASAARGRQAQQRSATPSPSSSPSASRSSSPPPRPQLHTIDDLAGDLDDLYSQLQPVQRFGGQGSSSGSGSKGSSSAESSPARPRIMTIDALEAASGSEFGSDHRPGSEHSSEPLSHLSSSRTSSPSSSSATSSPRGPSSSNRPRLMTVDQLQAVDSWEEEEEKRKPAVAQQPQAEEEHDADDLLAGLTMVRARSPGSSSSSGSHSSRKLYVIQEGGSETASTISTAEESPHGQAAAARPAAAGVRAPTPSTSLTRASQPAAPSFPASSGGLAMTLPPERGAGLSGSAGGGLGESSGDLPTFGGLGGVAPLWRMSQQSDGEVSQSQDFTASVEHLGPVAVEASAMFRPLQGAQFQPASPGMLGIAPPAVFGRPPSAHYIPGGSDGGGALPMRPAMASAVTQTDPTAHVVDLTPLGPYARPGVKVRTVALQVGSMNEVSTQVAFDGDMERLVEGATDGALLDPGFPGLGADVTELLPATAKSVEGAATLVGADSTWSYGHTTATATAGSLNFGAPAGRGLGPAAAAAGAGIPGVAALQAHLAGGFAGAGAGAAAGGGAMLVRGGRPATAGAPGAAGLFGAGWGVLSMAAQNLKAAQLLEQVERTAQHLQGLAAVAVGSMPQDAVPGMYPPAPGMPPYPGFPGGFAGMQGPVQGYPGPQGYPPRPGTAPGMVGPGGGFAAGAPGAGSVPGGMQSSSAGGAGSGPQSPGPGEASRPVLQTQISQSSVYRGSLPASPSLERPPMQGLVHSSSQGNLGSARLHGSNSLGRVGSPVQPVAPPVLRNSSGNSQQLWEVPRYPQGQAQAQQQGQQHQLRRGSAATKRPSGSSITEEPVTEEVDEEVYSEEFEEESVGQGGSTEVVSESDKLGPLGTPPRNLRHGSHAGFGSGHSAAGASAYGNAPAALRRSVGNTYSSSFLPEESVLQSPTVPQSEQYGGSYSQDFTSYHTTATLQGPADPSQSQLPQQQRMLGKQASGGGAAGHGHGHMHAPLHHAHSQHRSSGTGEGRHESLRRISASGGGESMRRHSHTGDAVQPQQFLLQQGSPLPGDPTVVSRRVSGVVGAGAMPGTELPAHNTMDLLQRPTAAPEVGPGQPQQPQNQQQQQPLPQMPYASAGQQQQPAMLTSMYGMSPAPGQLPGAWAGQLPAQQPAYAGTGNAAQDTLLRYHALLSSSALPGGLLDPAQLGRLRSELLASAATAAASSGVGYQDLAKESAADGSFKLQLLQIRSKLAGLRAQMPMSVGSTQAAAKAGLGAGVAMSASLGSLSRPSLGPGAGGVTGITLSSRKDREVIVDRTASGAKRLVDVGSYRPGTGGSYQYTTLGETLQLIRGYREREAAAVRAAVVSSGQMA